MNYTGIAAAMLTEVGLSFDDVLDLGRSWVLGPPEFEMQIDKPAYRGSCSYPNRNNKTSRQKPLISLTGPVDCDWMVYILAHECGHVAQGGWSSIPLYIMEYQAELYAIAAFARHCGRPLPANMLASAKANVRRHARIRLKQLGDSPTKGWDRRVLAWCGFEIA